MSKLSDGPRSAPFFHNESAKKGFTIIELLAAIGIICFLAVMGVTSYFSMAAKGRMVREVSAGRNLVQAYQAYAAENNGQYLPGMDYSVKTLFKPNGTPLTPAHVAQRYPFRLAPYFDWKLEGTILVNDTAKQIKKTMMGMYDYGVSAFPSFGINYYFVGGCVVDGPVPQITWANECLSRQAQGSPSILVFASAGVGDGTTKIDGYNILTPPNTKYANWSPAPWNKKAEAGSYGNIDARHNGKAVCVFVDGSVRLHAVEELRDMRLWNRNAAETDNPDYRIPADLY